MLRRGACAFTHQSLAAGYLVGVGLKTSLPDDDCYVAGGLPNFALTRRTPREFIADFVFLAIPVFGGGRALFCPYENTYEGGEP